MNGQPQLGMHSLSHGYIQWSQPRPLGSLQVQGPARLLSSVVALGLQRKNLKMQTCQLWT